MQRRRLLALTAGLVGFAGCSGDRSSPTPSESQSPTNSPSPTGSPTDTATPVFNPVIYYDSCTEISVQAGRYDSVTLFFDGPGQTFDDGYTGTTQFAGTGDNEGDVVYEVAVSLGQQTVTRRNPDLDDCLATATPSPTASPTASPTPAEQSAARRGLDVYAYENHNTDQYDVVISVDNTNDYQVKAYVTTRFYTDDDELYDRDESEHVIDANGETDVTHEYDGPDHATITDHEVEVAAEEW